MYMWQSHEKNPKWRTNMSEEKIIEYEYKCWRCEAIHVRESDINPFNRVFCPECKELFLKDKEKLLKDYSQLKVKVMYENALRMFEKANCHMDDFRLASFEILKDALERTEKYRSSHEMLVAIFLESEGYYFEINYRILNYRVDFYIPDLKICLEVDGALHTHKRKYDNKRDIELRNELGTEWEIVRIPTSHIENNPYKIIDAALELRNEKKKYRKNNHGIVPEYFSGRENEYYEDFLQRNKRNVPL